MVSKFGRSWRYNLRGLRTRKSDAVSEVIGDIMLVAISVAMMGLIAIQVSNFAPPKDTSRIDLVAKLDDNNLTITHMGGEDMDSYYTDIVVGLNQMAYKHYSIGDSSDELNGSRTWSIGQTWRIDATWLITEAGLSPGSEMFVSVVDKKNNNVLLDQVLKQGPSTDDFPDLGVEKNSLTYSNNNPDDGEMIMMNVTIANYGNIDVNSITVRWFDGKTEINSTNIPSLGYWNASDLPNCTKRISINWTTTYIGKHVVSVKVIPKLDETNLANNYLSRTLFVGAGIVEGILGPNIQIDTITMDNMTQNFEPISVIIVIHNSGQTAAGYDLEINDSFEGVPNGIRDTITTSDSPFTFGALNPSDDKTIKMEWIPTKGGMHSFQVRVTNVTPSENDAEIPISMDKDFAAVDLRVLPNVLLVDDDKAASGSPRDTVTHMKDALTAIGVSPDIYTVTAGDGPQYSQVGMEPYYLAKYDVVVWMTGYENTNTLTKVGATSDVTNLGTFLTNGGSLWLIGQDILSNLGTGNAFVQNWLHVTGFTAGGEDAGISDPIEGVTGNLVTEGMFFNTTVPGGMPNRADYITIDGTKAVGLMMHDTAHIPNSVVSNATTRGGDTNKYKVAFCAFDFSQIRTSGERAIFSYIMLEWFNATAELNTDLSVSDIQFTPKQPHFKQDVNITVWVRNNGKTDLDGVRIVFKDVINGIDTLINVSTLDYPGGGNPMTISSTLAGYGGWIKVAKHWTPDVVGYHTIRAIVDPENLIAEVNEANNEINSILTPTEVFVESITLVVDDEHQAGDKYTQGNVTTFVTESLTTLKYSYEVSETSGASGPDSDTLTKYNSVIWVASDLKGDVLTATDITNLKSYLTGYRGNLWLIGQGLTESNSWSDASWLQTLGVLSTTTNNGGTPANILGVYNSAISHGMSYPTDFSGFTPGVVDDHGDLITPDTTAGALGTFRNAAGGFNGVALHNTSGVDYRTLVSTFEYGCVDDKTDQLEMMYLVQHWFGQADDRIELRVTGVDIFFGRDNAAAMAFDDVKPVLGDSYILQAKIRNYGGTPAGAVVRFVDGSTVINSANVYVPASTVNTTGEVIPGSGIAEVIWTPLFAGNRPITVKVDPDMNIPQTTNPRDPTGEVFKKNNNATRYTQVYFFFDNMEKGVGDWTHDTTIVNINGEQAIEYFDSVNPIATNIINGTDPGQTNGWVKTESDAHTKPSSYTVAEPSKLNASRPPIRLAFCIDDSGSMGGSYGNDPTFMRLNAAYNVVSGDLTTVDWVTLWRFDSGVTRLVAFESGSHSATLTSLGPPPAAHPAWDNNGGTNMYECMNQALDYIATNLQPGEYPALIVLTDGGANGAMSYGTIKDAVMSKGIPVYTSSVGHWVDVPAMYELGMRSNGGKYYAAKTAADLNGMFKDIISEILTGASSRATFTLNYTADDGTFFGTGDFQYGAATSGPGSCRGGSGNCWATILNGNYNPSGTTGTRHWLFGPWYYVPGDTSTLTMNTWYWANIYNEWSDYAHLHWRYRRANGAWSAGVDAGSWGTIGTFTRNTGGWVQMSSGELRNSCTSGGSPYGTNSCRGLWVQFVIDFHKDNSDQAPGLYIDDWSVVFNGINATDEEVILEQPIGTEQWWNHLYRNITWYYYGSTASPTATIEFSDDDGTTWGNVATGVPVISNGERNWYNWTTPDNISDQCRIRVTVGAAVNESGNFELFGPNFNNTGPIAYNNFTTPYFAVNPYDKLKLNFWQKYDLLNNDNGGVITVGVSNLSTGPYKYYYIIPTKPYPGNLRLDKNIYDEATPPNRILWAWTGRSAGNTLGWEFVEVDLTPYTNYNYMRVRLSFINWGLGTGGGWWVDDFKVTASRADTDAVNNTVRDQWEYRVDPNDPLNHIWWNHNPDDGHDLIPGVDNSLYTKNIDLTKAKYAYFNARFKFNLDDASGRPPDGFRVEVSDDNGVTWRPINLGVRASWGVSGDYIHGIVDERSPTGTQAYCGIQDSGLDAANAQWVQADTLWRLNVNISGWNGEVVKLRFRVVTNLDTHHYASWGAADPWKGFAVDDVVVSGETLVSG